MFVLGLTGSIAMGKTTVAGMFRRLGVPVHDADAAVHLILATDPAAIAEIAAAFPGAVREGAVDRKALGAEVFGRAGELEQLERILHPRVRRAQTAFLKRHCRRRASMVLLDIPLLFETGGDRNCDAVAVVSAPAMTQKRRVLARPGMDEARLKAVLARQMADAEKRRRADFVVPTGLGKALSLAHVRRIVQWSSVQPGGAWPPV